MRSFLRTMRIYVRGKELLPVRARKKLPSAKVKIFDVSLPGFDMKKIKISTNPNYRKKSLTYLRRLTFREKYDPRKGYG